ncbi:TIGR00270 family protein [Candidatus Bathyarchaeota archaeon]|nr:MAG: TIGR00270 family protein [Candidatus Bathyarchaeota archaeon]
MFCEVCGREIVGRPSRSLVEGVTMIVCKHCAGLGTELPSPPARPASKAGFSPRAKPPVGRLPREYLESDLVEDYSRVIKEAREKVKLSQQDLAMKAKAKLSMIQKIEIGKMEPPIPLSRELEHILHVKLLVPREEIEVPIASLNQEVQGVSIGDVAVVKEADGDELEDDK